MSKAKGVVALLIVIVAIIIFTTQPKATTYVPVKDATICQATDLFGCGESTFVNEDGDNMTGNLQFEQGSQPRFNVTIEIIIPVSRLRLPGTNPPALTTIGLTPTLKFDKNTNESVNSNGHMPANYYDGTGIEFVFYWFPDDNTAGDVMWCLEFRGPLTANNGELITGTSMTTCVLDSTTSTQYELLKATKISIPGTGINEDDNFAYRVFRGADDPSDTYDADADLFITTVYFQSDKIGET